MPTWTKEMALEIIAAGYKSMARKYHPDVGGKHEDMIALTATKEHLEGVLAGRTSDWRDHRRDSDSYRRQQDHEYHDRMRRASEEAERKRSYWRNQKANTPNEEVPIEPYPHDDDYFQLADVTIMSVTEKAIKIKIPGVKSPQWLPKSQLHDEMDPHFIDGDVITVVFTRWIAQQKGWLK